MNINATLLGQMIAFGLFVWFLLEVCLATFISSYMEEELQKLNKVLKILKTAPRRLLKPKRIKKNDHKSKSEAKKVLDNAKSQAEKIVDDAKNKANEEKDRIVGSAQSEIEKEVVNAKKSLEKDFATNVMAAAKKIISKEISSSNHEETINKKFGRF